MADIIQLRRGTAANWTSVDPILAQGELGVELDTGKIKVGNGTSNWSSLPYLAGEGGGSTVVASYEHIQAVPSAVWTVNHNMGFNPAGISIIDSGGNNVRGVITYIDINNLTITFSAGFSGKAYLS